MNHKREIEILLVDDDPGDVELTKEGLKDSKMLLKLNIVDDGIKAMKYLRRESPYTDALRPDVVLLDLNLPRKDGREVLKEIKGDETLRSIPVVVLTTSQDECDLNKCYELGANCFITKPVGFEEFVKIVRTIQDFWFAIVKLPH